MEKSKKKINCSGGGISYVKSTIKGDQYHHNHKIKSLITNHGVFEDEFKVQGCEVDRFTLFDTSFEKAVFFTPIDEQSKVNAPIRNIFLNDSRFKGGFNFIGNQGKYGIDWRVEALIFNFSALLSGNIIIEGVDLVSLVFKGTNVNGNVLLRNCNVSSVSIDNFSNSAQVTFANIGVLAVPNSIWSIQNSLLGRFNLLNIDFRLFGEFLIIYSSVVEISFSYVNWHLGDKLNSRLEGDVKIAANRELYRQLKYAADRQGDRIQSLIFKAKEMTYLRRALRAEKKLSMEHCGNRFMMFLNRSNDYGQDWLKPIVLLLLSNLIFYFLILLSASNELCFCLDFSTESVQRTWKIFNDNLSIYWSLLNPVRRLKDILPDVQYSAWTTFWDFFSRIVVSFFIFQIVSAFRKYVN